MIEWKGRNIEWSAERVSADDVETVVDFMAAMVMGLSHFFLLLAFAALHLALAVAALYLLWQTGTTPEEVRSWTLRLATTWPVQFATFVGLSGPALCLAYWRSLLRLHAVAHSEAFPRWVLAMLRKSRRRAAIQKMGQAPE